MRPACAACARSPRLIAHAAPARTSPPSNRTSDAGTPYFSDANAIRRSLIVRAAACAALPLRSLPDEAAVADVFGTLLVSVALARTCSSGMPNSSATTCATLVYSPWPISVPP
jgi:hypothetical protein